MRSQSELLKIKEAFALAMLDLLDVYDELLATGRIYVADDSDEPTVNDLAKNQEESNAI
jgi:hypothetical protein